MSSPIDSGPRPTNTGVQGTNRGNKAAVDDPAQQPRDANQGAQESGDRSVESSRLQAVRDRIDGTPEVDRDRVESLKAQIASGEYVVDADRVAQKFAELEGLLNS